VRFLVAEAGIRQFLDIGTGLPSANNVHEVAQGLVPSCRVVYVDNDPIVLAHARALLTSAPEGRTSYIQADLREPEKILGDPVTRQTLDFSQPIALMLVAVLHFVPDEEQPRQIVDTLLGALPPGSYLVASHVTPEHDPEGVGGLVRTYQASGLPAQARAAADFAGLAFRGLDMADPGLVLVSEWRPDAGAVRPQASEVNWYGAIARKP
jgi:O-methyltransferase involved in polyketide biosynthesis